MGMRALFRVDYWFPDVDTFYRAVTGMPLHDLNTLPEGYEERRIYFPINDKRVEKAIGCEFPKLQLFFSLTVMRDEDAMARLMRDPRYKGDLLLASRSDYAAYRTKSGAVEPAGVGDREADVRSDASTQAGGSVRVLRATTNTVTVRTILPEGAAKYWLYFADAWHPFWHAQVNGLEAPILRANFGFEAIEIPSGMAIVKFAYRSNALSGALAVAQVLLILTMLGVIVIGVRQLLYP